MSWGSPIRTRSRSNAVNAGFDAGYCSFYATAPGYCNGDDKPEYHTSIDLKEVPRHPDAAAAILVTGVHFGDITGAKPHSGTKELSI